ncbi:MAG: dephospho-CoA kinase [Chloroflexota bacterium]
MGKWSGKFVIGLTGNIATGKSVVRRMLEHLGAYGIDADALAHRAISKGAPGYQATLDQFGKWILDSQGEIDRARLASVVFNEPEALNHLEAIVHPLVEHAVDLMIQRASQRVIVIEAIKLLEGTLGSQCDTIWVTYSPEEVQKDRLMRKRSMTADEALHRIRIQTPQDAKKAAANLVITNIGSFEETWQQIVAGWKKLSTTTDATPTVVKIADTAGLAVHRGRVRDIDAISELITRLNTDPRPFGPDDVMAAFGEKAFLLLIDNETLVGLAGWQVENLVSRTTDLYLDPSVLPAQALKTLISEVEKASTDLQCEAALVFLPPHLVVHVTTWKELGYERRTPHSLSVRAWQEAAEESMPANTVLLFKQLRVDRILRPI